MIKRFLLFSILLTCSASAWAAAETGKVVNIPPPATTNIAATNSVLTINVDHGVPLTLSAPASSVFIANPDIADVQVMSPTSIMIFGKRTGETTFMATDSNGTTLAQRTVIVSQDLSTLRQELNAAIPGNKIHVESLPNGLVLTGETKDSASVADAYKMAQRYVAAGGDIINRVRVVGSNQIMIRVRFAEVQRNIDNELGFNWSNLATTGGFALGLATGITGVTGGSSIIGDRPNNTNLNLPNDVLGVSRTGGHYNVNAVIDALAQDGLVTILAEPNLTAMSGETANFLAGGSFPVPVPQGNNAISIQFQPYGISLEFTPTLIGEDRINLHVKPEVSQLTTTGSVVIDNIAVPALLTRRAETTVEIASGQSFAIAGLLDNSQAQTVNKFPILGDVPILGALFRDSQFQNGQTELIIVITPYIVKPSGEQLALPMDGLSPPSEIDRLVGLRYSGSNPDARTQSGAPVGKLVEPPSASAIIPVPVLPASALTPAGGMPTSAAEPDAQSRQALEEASLPATPAIPVTASPINTIPAASSAHGGPTNLMPAGPGGFVVE